MKLNGTAPHFGEGLFRSCVVDPPWPYKQVTTQHKPGGNKLSGYVTGGLQRRGREDEGEYSTLLSIDDMCTLPVGQLVDGYCFLWTTGPWLRQGFDLLDAWGFKYATALHWLKKTKAGKIPYGAGYWYRGAVETILVARKPDAPSVRTHQRNVFEAVRLGHSTKPDSFQDHVEQFFPGPYLELFARRDRPGWTCLGDECPSDGRDIRVSLPALLTPKRRRVVRVVP